MSEKIKYAAHELELAARIVQLEDTPGNRQVVEDAYRHWQRAVIADEQGR